MSTSHGDFAAIRRFPAEILVEIFSYHTSSLVGFSANADAQLWTELDCLAKTGLLTLSRVWSRWHSIVFDIPTLWSTLLLHGILWRTPYALAKTVTLLSAALAWSQNAPLSMIVIESARGSGRLLHGLRPRRKRSCFFSTHVGGGQQNSAVPWTSIPLACERNSRFYSTSSSTRPGRCQRPRIQSTSSWGRPRGSRR
ncbi:hypothetical protein DFH08DRAFT_888289 [Mycena albidolilacea]|uniref:F-box domain-containing protein n=1 Tax=Mycena albidolilacea TaxID=1033008 RepID=A0AAD7EHZ9_9AGAR|nr:hypothetical protein DFH08DRAFT_888289 [Mycena albidolilacea]